MPRLRYQEIKFRADSLAMIEQANRIIAEYQAQGFVLTLRQLYYQFVARDLIPNTERSYKRLGSIVADGRLAGLIDWEAIEDRTRNLEELAHWRNPQEILSAVARQFRHDLWATQKRRVEVWIEKEALAGVVAGVCNELDVPYFACRGYVSASEQWRAGRRAYDRARNRRNPQSTLILHFGDHDPSGMDMTRDNDDRLAMFSGGPLSTRVSSMTGSVEVRRLALNWDQIEEYGPPPNPAKVTDSRFDAYQARYGDESWELDALEPAVLVGLIRQEVERERDPELWEAAVERQERERADLTEAQDRWLEVVDFLRDRDPNEVADAIEDEENDE